MLVLQHCLTDQDDEVRDRVVFSLNLLEAEKRAAGGPPSSLKVLSTKEFNIPLGVLEKMLLQARRRKEPIVLKAVKEASATAAPGGAAGGKADSMSPGVGTTGDAAAQKGMAAVAAARGTEPVVPAAWQKIPPLAALGAPLTSGRAVELTGTTSAEYRIACVKHAFAEHVVFEVRCSYAVFALKCLDLD